ncbi:MAG: transcription termination/antitermination protein NusA [Pelagibacterales bacterium]|nr:transcription termination/antitermination protein NusA [Pelagibacterales bacterium]
MSEKEGLSVVRPELLQIAEAVARDKSIEQNIVIEAMEQAIQSVAKKKYGQDLEVKASIDEKTGEIKINRVLHVVDNIEDSSNQISLEEGKGYNKDAKLGDTIYDPLPPIDFGRVAAQTAKQVIVQRVKEADKERQFIEFQDKQGQIINGVVKRVEYGNVFLDLGKAEAYMRKDDTIARETFRPGDRVRAYITSVKKDLNGPQIYLSRTCNDFMAALFSQEVPEIYDGIIKIISVARDPGSRAKIAVLSNDKTIDPVGACVGMRGSRVQAIVNELQGEKIDIITWSEDAASFIVNTLSPAEVTKVVLDEENKKVEVIVPDDQLSLAIGRKGQNVRLASQVSKWEITILTEGAESERRQVELKKETQTFIDALVIDDVIAHLLVSEGFKSIEAVAYVPLEELQSIEGFDENLAKELKERAIAYLDEKEEELEKERVKLGIEDEMKEIEGLDQEMIVILGKNNIKTKNDLADLSSDELLEILEGKFDNNEEADKIIMKAREDWFKE